MSDQGMGDDTPPHDDGAGQGSNRTALWVIAGLLAAIVVLLLFLLLRDDGGDDDTASGDTTTSSSTSTSTSSSTSSSTSTTAPPTTSTTAPPATTTTSAGSPPITADPAQCRDAGSDPTNPDPAAQAVFIAWTRGDTGCADELMGDDALAELFSRDGSGATDVFQGCVEEDVPDPHMNCAFTYPGGSTHYRMNFSPTEGWQVYEVYQVAD